MHPIFCFQNTVTIMSSCDNLVRGVGEQGESEAWDVSAAPPCSSAVGVMAEHPSPGEGAVTVSQGEAGRKCCFLCGRRGRERWQRAEFPPVITPLIFQVIRKMFLCKGMSDLQHPCKESFTQSKSLFLLLSCSLPVTFISVLLPHQDGICSQLHCLPSSHLKEWMQYNLWQKEMRENHKGLES